MNLIQLFFLFLSLSILIVLHELGHFIPAKLFGTRVKKFYLFFDFLFPFPKILNFSLFKKKIGDTEYGIGWFPFGGYVDIAGMVDETTTEEELDKDDTPKEQQFRFKPAWQRLIVMIGGVTVNMILAMVIYTGLLMAYGEEYLPMKNATNGIMVVDSIGYDLGLQDGDKIISINGNAVENFNDFEGDLLLNQAKTIRVYRDNQFVDLPVKSGVINKFIKKSGKNGGVAIIEPRFPTIVDQVTDGSNAKKAGLQVGDKFLAIDSVATPFFDEVKTQLSLHKNATINILVDRNGTEKILTANVTKEGTLGYAPNLSLSEFYKTEKKSYGLFAAIPAGIKQSFETLAKYFKSIKMLFTSPEVKAKDSLGGFYSIGKIFPRTFDWRAFWSITALISVILAFMNILPIPMLDGGYVLFLLIEMLIGRPVPQKIQNAAQTVGFVIVLFLLFYSNGLDIMRAFGK
ncbi:MAG: RIP metalloprotease RseP [Chitinophagales bacterium]|nr:RIP metalloprotease RseP [Chitinophagales bacterium]